MTARRDAADYPPAPVGKAEMRDRLLVRRRSLSSQARDEAGRAIARLLLETPEVAAARRVAAYVSLGTEPPTPPLLESLRDRGVDVIVPVLQEDLDLAWAQYSGDLESGLRGTLQPAGARRLETSVVASVDVVVCPGVAVDRSGMRLGRGGGSYDRALARLGQKAWTCVLLYDDEVLDAPLPHEEHDQRVRAAVTPTRVVRFS